MRNAIMTTLWTKGIMRYPWSTLFQSLLATTTGVWFLTTWMTLSAKVTNVELFREIFPVSAAVHTPDKAKLPFWNMSLHCYQMKGAEMPIGDLPAIGPGPLQSAYLPEEPW